MRYSLLSLLSQPSYEDYPPPNAVSLENAEEVLEVCAQLEIVPCKILRSGEGGVFIAFLPPSGQLANMEVFNDGELFACTHKGEINVWEVRPNPESIREALIRVMELGCV